MSSDFSEEDSQLLRQRPIETEEFVDEEEELNEKETEIEKLKNSDSETEELETEVHVTEKRDSEDEKDIINSNDSNENSSRSPASSPVLVYRGVRNLQPIQRPSFIVRQFRNVKNFFIEFLTTLFNPMADVNVQVQEHQQRRAARDGKFYSSCKPTRFPGCGPSA